MSTQSSRFLFRELIETESCGDTSTDTSSDTSGGTVDNAIVCDETSGEGGSNSLVSSVFDGSSTRWFSIP